MTISWNGEAAPIPPGGSYGYARVSTTDQDWNFSTKLSNERDAA